MGNFTTKLHEIDNEVKIFIASLTNIHHNTKKLIMNKWFEFTDIDKERINKKWANGLSFLMTNKLTFV